MVTNGFADGWNGFVSKICPGQLSVWVMRPVASSRTSTGVSSYTLPVSSRYLISLALSIVVSQSHLSDLAAVA